MWEHYKRIVKDNGAIVLTASQPFTTTLISSNMEMFKYCWVWKKSRKTGFQMAAKRPMKEHEDILVFYKKQPAYNQNLKKLYIPKKSWRKNGKGGNLLKDVKTNKNRMQEYTGFNTDIIEINNENNVGKHPTQKPVALIEYLIKTYTNENDTVLDNCMGSGTAGVSCMNLNRKFIGIELDEKYFNISERRIKDSRGLFNINKKIEIRK